MELLLDQTDLNGEFVVIDTGVGEVAKYYPVLFQVIEQDERATYYLEDLRTWAAGDISGIVGMERQVITGLAQAVLSYTERAEGANPSPPTGMRRIERREDDET